MRHVSAITALGLVFALLVSACGSAGEAAGDDLPQQLVGADWGYVGGVDGTRAFIATLWSGGEAIVYVCDGEEGIAEWFRGNVSDDATLELRSDSGARVVATRGGDGLSGVVTLGNGDQHAFNAPAAREGAGLLRVTGDDASSDEVVAGWIVDNDGEQRGSLRVRGTNRAVPALPRGPLVLSGKSYPVSVFFIAAPKPATPPGVPIPYPNTAVIASLWGNTRSS